MMLVIMRLDLLGSGKPRGPGPRFVSPESKSKLLVTLIDPSLRATCAPITLINLERNNLYLYNEILGQFQGLWKQFYRVGGFIDRPETYTSASQSCVLAEMFRIGRAIRDLFYVDDHVGKWLLDLFKSATDGLTNDGLLQPVTILTNDFDVPWFWLEHGGQFLCEVCSLGLLQLSTEERPMSSPHDQRKTDYDALLIKGSSTTSLPFLDQELNRIEKRLSEPGRFSDTFNVLRAEKSADLERLCSKFRRRSQNVRIVHFSGHYSGEKLVLGEEEVSIYHLDEILDGSLLVLDGSSSARELEAWIDAGGFTAALINKGALGCVVTALPVKHDPIVSRILWDTFYRSLRGELADHGEVSKRVSVGQALAKARIALRDYFKAIGSPNPAWAVYQMIGNTVVQLWADSDKK
jgi:hypothetical protein